MTRYGRMSAFRIRVFRRKVVFAAVCFRMSVLFVLVLRFIVVCVQSEVGTGVCVHGLSLRRWRRRRTYGYFFPRRATLYS